MQHKFWVISVFLLVLFLGCDGQNLTDETTSAEQVIKHTVVSFPESLSQTCRDGIANIYDECGSQQLILDDAIAAGLASNKTVLILYGAEWCIWCHVFDKYVKGQSRKFDYKWQFHDGDNLVWSMREKANEQAEQEANALNKYFADNFILAHIESYYAPDGEQVLAELNYDVDKIVGVPVVLVLDDHGQIAGEMRSSKDLIGLEIRSDSGEEFRGYDRNLLLEELERLKNLAVGNELE